jgi:hypothetical protein
MHQFQIAPVGGGELAAAPFQFTNSALWMLIVLGVIVVFMWGGTKRQLVPGRWQASVEMLTGFLDNITQFTQLLSRTGRTSCCHIGARVKNCALSGRDANAASRTERTKTERRIP